MQVDFDKSRHLSDTAIRKRRIEREKLIEIEKLKKEEEQTRRWAAVLPTSAIN